MPRNAKESDDEMEAKSGRRTRAALNPSVLDSPLRRSSRIKQPVQQDSSSPDSVSDISNAGTTRSTRRKTTTGDGGITEAIKGSRTRRNSVASDISELTETESLPDGPPKRVTRRSIARGAVVDTPPSLNERTRRATRAGSESKSTPPVGRITRKNRASSLEPEATEEQIVREVGTPIKSRRRASAVPSEPAVAEESEYSRRSGRRASTKTVYEVDEDASDSQILNTSKSSRRMSKNDANEAAENMEVDENTVGKSEANAIERSARENTEAAADVSHEFQKLDDSNKAADSSETKKVEDGSSQSFSSPSRGSSYTIESLLSPSTDKQEKSPGNKENENLNDSVVLLEKTVKLSNRSDVRFATRNSLDLTKKKSQEKRFNVSVDDIILSDDYEIPTKAQKDIIPSKVTRKERYSVDDCVVIIEPMEINRIDKNVNAKIVNTPESPKTRKTYQIEEITSEETKIKEVECISLDKEEEDTENVIIEKLSADRKTNFKISNVVSIAVDEKDEKMYEPEPMDVDESPDTFYLELKDTNEENEEKTENEGRNDEEVSGETSRMNTKSRTLISENKEPQVYDSKEKATSNSIDDEKTSTEPSVSNNKIGVLNPDENASKDNINDKNAPSEPLASNAKPLVLNTEMTPTKDGLNEGNASSENSVSSDEPRASNFGEKSISDDGNDKTTSSEQTLKDRASDATTSTEHLISNIESSTSNSEEKIPSDVVNDGKPSEKPSNPIIELTASDLSINNGKPINADEIEDNLVCAKDRKSSLVTESTTTGAIEEEATNVSEEKRRKSASKASEEEKKNDDTEEKSAEKEVEAEGKTAHQSNDESESDGYSAFKDIPADEWTGVDTENNKKNTDIDTNSVHSVSTERNGSEFDFELIDREYLPSSEKEDNVKSDYDSDDTMKIAVVNVKSVEPEDVENDVSESVTCEETPMEVSSDEEETDIKTNNSISMKNTSLNTSRKSNESKTPNKNISLIAETSAKASPIGLNSSRRKSLVSVDDQSNDNLSSSMKINSSVNNSLKKNSLNASAHSEEEENSDNNGEADSTEVVKTPKINSRKSLDASAKKSTNTPDLSKSINSAKNTPSIAENRANETSAKRNRSLTKSAMSLLSDDAENTFDNITESEQTIEKNKIASAKYRNDVFLSASNSPATPKIDKKRSSLNKSEKIDSAKKSADRNLSKSETISCDSYDVEEESQGDVSSPKIPLNESRKSVSAKKSKIDKNNWILTPNSVNVIKSHQDSPASPEPGEKGLDKFAKSKKPIKIPLNNSSENAFAYADSPASPDPKDKGLDISAKLRSLKKSASKNRLDSVADNSDSEIDTQELHEMLVKSSMIGSAKKSAKSSRSSVISSDSAVDDEDKQENLDRSQKSVSAKKSAIDKNYSTIAQVNSDSDVDENVESDTTDDDADISRKIPSFLFNYSSDSNCSDSSNSIDSDIERDMNLHGKSVLEYSDDDVPADDCVATESESSDDDDDGADLMDFVVDDDDEEDFSDVEHDLGLDDDESHESLSSEEKTPRKRIIPRPPRDSDSDDSEEEPSANVSSRLNKSNPAQTPIKPAKLNKTQEILETEAKPVDLNISAKNIATKNKNLLSQCSTPKTVASQSLLSEQLTSSKTTTPLNKSAEMANSSLKVDVSTSKKLSKSVCEVIQTPAKLASSFKLTKAPKTSLSVQEQLQTSLPADLNETTAKTNLSKVKSTKLSTLNQTVVPPSSESPETRFLMKQKLNDSMPALKLQRRSRALRKSLLDNLREGIEATELVSEEVDEMQEEDAEEQMSLSKEDAASTTEVSSEKKKKKKKKKQAAENSEEIITSLTESVTEVNDELNTSTKKSKKIKKKKLAETLEQKETKSERILKKGKKKHDTVVENVASEDADKKGKKKKEKKQEQIIKNVVLDELDKKERKKKKKHDHIIENVVLNQLDEKERKKKRKREEIVEKVVLDEGDKKEMNKKHLKSIDKLESDDTEDKKKKKKEKKDRKLAETSEPEVPALRQKSRPIPVRNDRDSDSDQPEAMDFTVARDAAMRDLRKLTDSIKAGEEAKKKKHQENLSLKEERKAKTRAEVAGTSEEFKTSIKRLPDDILESLSDVPERPKKRRKMNKEEVPPSKTTLSPLQAKSGNFQVESGYIPLSSTGGTTQFSVVNLKKAVKHSKKALAASSFRERMLARNPRQPVSAYLMYQQKQKHSGSANKLY